MLYCFEIPIIGYELDSIYNQQVFIEAEQCPTKDELLHLLESLHSQDSQYAGYFDCWKQCIESVNKVEEFPQLADHIVETNSFTEVKIPHNQKGRYPLVVKRIIPHIIPPVGE